MKKLTKVYVFILVILISLIATTNSFAEEYSDQWEVVGSKGFLVSDKVRMSSKSLYVYNETPYVAFVDENDNYRINVVKYDGSDWEKVGDGYECLDDEEKSLSSISEPRLYIDNGTIYIMFEADYTIDKKNSKKFMNVIRYNGSDWEHLGAKDFVVADNDFESFIVYDGTPYLAWRSNIIKYDGERWIYLSNIGLPDAASHTCIVIYEGEMYLAFSDSPKFDPYIQKKDYKGRITVMKFDGSKWEPIGDRGFSRVSGGYNLGASRMTLFIENGEFYVAYYDWNIGVQYYGSAAVVVKKFNGKDWITLGNEDGSLSGSIRSFYVYNGVPYLAYAPRLWGDALAEDQTYVAKYEEGHWNLLGDTYYTKNDYGSSIFISNDKVYVAYRGVSSYNLGRYNLPAVKVISTDQKSPEMDWKDFGETKIISETNKKWTVLFNRYIEWTAVDIKNIYVSADEYGREKLMILPREGDIRSDVYEEFGMNIIFNQRNYHMWKKDVPYYIFITDGMKDAYGNDNFLKEPIRMKFIIN